VVPIRKTVSILVLTVLIAILAYLAHARGLRPALGGPTAALEGRFAKEEAWIVDEIVRDVTEMSAYPSAAGTVTIESSGDGTYRVSVAGAAPFTAPIDLRDDLWSPAHFGAISRAALAASSSRRANESIAPIYPELLNFTPASLVAANATVSRSLAADMRNPSAHEAAALTLGVFAMRESAAKLSDTRWAINRMTAHLALAGALRGDASPGVDGQLATSILWMLANHETRALQALDSVSSADRSDALDRWKRAIRVHLTEDRRPIANLADASPLERREYFRAYRATVPYTNGMAAVEQVGAAPTADSLRIVEAYGLGVEDGDVLERALTAERAESDEVFQRMHGHAMGDWAASLNARAGRLIGASGRPDVLPWGAWAEFAQRHIAMFVGRSDAYYRHTIGSEHRADTEKARLKRELGSLRVFPIATIFWTKGVGGGDADLGLINEAISSAVAAPELVPAAAWRILDDGSHYEPVRRSMPASSSWFVPPAPRAPYEAAARLRETHAPIVLATIDAMRRESPYDWDLAWQYLTMRFGMHPPAEDVRHAFGPRLEYDERALEWARTFAPDDAEVRIGLARTSCELSAAQCIALGSELAAVKREEEAAAAYERAFADSSLDAVGLSNWSGWLVSYYYRHGRLRSALDLADRAASTGAAVGLNTKGYLYERLGRVREAEALFRDAAVHYKNWAQLLGFYYRAVNVRHQTEFDEAWKLALARVFPDGLVRVTTNEAQPAHGLVVVKDNARSRAAGLQAGDIIVGLEGWNVDNIEQYYAINAFPESEHVTLTAWRGHLFSVAADAPNRLFGIQFRTYPIHGWRDR